MSNYILVPLQFHNDDQSDDEVVIRISDIRKVTSCQSRYKTVGWMSFERRKPLDYTQITLDADGESIDTTLTVREVYRLIERAS